MRFEIVARSASCHARVGRVTTAHGAFDTPAFMPVGTRGTVKGVLPNLVSATGAQVVLGNTLHLLLRPGPDVVARLGGLHAFMGWPGPILTDSGGYQAYSLADTNRVTDDSVVFKSIVDGALVELTPERAIDVQNKLGADIIMALDDCPPSVDPATMNQSRQRIDAQRAAADRGRRGYDHGRRLDVANERTIRWLERCKKAHAREGEQSLFGIVQGGTDLLRRDWCLERVCAVDLPGYAIGGVAVGEGFDEIVRVVEHAAPRLPVDKPRYLMGVGYERDLLAAVRAGVDMFDCVLPTRNGRNAVAFTPEGPLRLRNARFAEDPGPIDPSCDCLACRPGGHGWALPPGGGGAFSRAYLRHLFMAEEMLGPILVSIHNLRHFQRLMLDIRAAIRDDAWSALARRWPVAARPAGLDSGQSGDERPET
ncbi:MAG: tRNA guanosine(34) transglycosylase Tgt [Phycisphaerales bacterium]|nr:tRNA guanosine(34) transglycosylase Tgt [Phycisphaerales bacterium]